MNVIIQEDIKKILSIVETEILMLEDKNILITGASGMLASYLVFTIVEANKILLKKPCNLYLILRNKTSKFANTKHIHYIYRDIAQSKLFLKKDFHYIIHAASKAAPKLYIANMLDTINTNIKGLYNVLDLVSKNTESILYFSSGEVYGYPEDNKPVKENYIGKVDHLNKRSCYIEGKRACESILMNYFWEKKYPVKIARIFHTFGPGLNLEDGRVFSDFIKDGLKNKDIEIKGDKNFIRSFLYIKDSTIMFLKILLSDKNGEIYNVGCENTVTIENLAKITCQTFNNKLNKKIKVIVSKVNNQNYKNAISRITPDISKFKDKFIYTPDTSIKEALYRTICSLL